MKIQKEINERVKLLSYLVTCRMARGEGKPMNGEMLLIFEALQELFKRIDKEEGIESEAKKSKQGDT